MSSAGSRYRVLTDEQWARIVPLLPSNTGMRGHPFGDSRRVVEGITYRFRTDVAAEADASLFDVRAGKGRNVIERYFALADDVSDAAGVVPSRELVK